MINWRQAFAVVLLLMILISGYYFLYPTDQSAEKLRGPRRFINPNNPVGRLLDPPPGTPSSSSLPSPESFDGIDQRLLQELEERNISPLAPPAKTSVQKVRLGRWLFWEKELSGNRDISCGFCHNPTTATTDHLSLSIGPNALGDSIDRHVKTFDDFMARNSQDLFNKGQSEWRSFFWDMRIERTEDGSMTSPAPENVTETFDHLLEMQTVFPLINNDELRGEKGDTDLFGRRNLIADYPDTAYGAIWDRYLQRLTRYETYVSSFRKVYPSVNGREDVEIQHVGDALSTFIETAFTLRNSPWDKYLAGRTDALSRAQKKGALLFYGKARCAECHSGDLMTDQKAHNIGVPQLGPGREPFKPYDYGRFGVTGEPDDKFAFRTPPLRNVSVTGPWMHNGAYKSLEGAVRHHLNPEKALRSYDKSQLGRDIQKYHRSPNWVDQLEQFPSIPPGTRLIPSVKDEPQEIEMVLSTLDQELRRPIELTKQEFDNLMQFLFSLTSPTLYEKPYRNQNDRSVTLTQKERISAARMTPYNNATVPDTTPSGIPVDCVAEWCVKNAIDR